MPKCYEKAQKHIGGLSIGEEHAFEAKVKWISNEPSSRSQDIKKQNKFIESKIKNRLRKYN